MKRLAVSEPVMEALARAVFLAQTLDAASFAVFVLVIPVSIQEVEQNPLVAGLYGLGGFAVVILFKVGGSAAIGYASTHLTLRHRRIIAALMLVAAVSGIVGAGFNIASLIHGLR